MISQTMLVIPSCLRRAINTNDDSTPSDQQKHILCLPYVKVLWKTQNKVHPEKQKIVYGVPCGECDRVYEGETGILWSIKGNKTIQ